MTIPASLAAQAYAAAAKSIADPARMTPAGATTQETGFGDLLKEALDAVTTAGDSANKTAVQQITGKADMVDVVTAVTETELAVQTLVSVRDRVISAYQEVMRMPI